MEQNVTKLHTIYALMVISLSLHSVVASAKAAAVTDTDAPHSHLVECYRDYPFFLDAMTGISDQDFADRVKSQSRRSLIKKEFAKNPARVRSCLDHITLQATKEKNPQNANFARSRMSEISGIVCQCR